MIDCRALATEGIQKGHMGLHAQNIAIAGMWKYLTVAGALPHSISECVAYMIETSKITQNCARKYLDAHHLQVHLAGLSIDCSNQAPPSMFYFEDSSKSDGGQILSLNIAFKTYGKPMNIIFTEKEQTDPNAIVMSIFGDKSFRWITTAFQTLERVKICTTGPARSNHSLSKKLKFLRYLPTHRF